MYSLAVASLVLAGASVCLTSADRQIVMQSGEFQLRWTHSIEKTVWTESWRVSSGELHLEWASVKTSGAGMEIPENAVYRDGVYHYTVERSVSELRLLQTGSQPPYQVCIMNECKSVELWLNAPSLKGEIVIAPCEKN